MLVTLLEQILTMYQLIIRIAYLGKESMENVSIVQEILFICNETQNINLQLR